MTGETNSSSKYPHGFSFWTNEADANAIKSMADESGLTISSYLRWVTRTYLRSIGAIAPASKQGVQQHGR